MYIYDAAEDNFKGVPDIPVSASTWIHNAQKALQRIELGEPLLILSTCCHVHSLTVTYMRLRSDAVDLCVDCVQRHSKAML